ncbi:MAG: antibiotic biosynthesis monooxygenase [Acidimicrobiia bacterium]|nr:antibiotic biosynthesis monooxygenase [Acidimicrobiia bacterium]
MIVVAGWADFGSDDARDQAVAASAPFQQATRSDEAGCLAYYFAPDPVIGHRMVVYELWEDEASLAAHFGHQNYFGMQRHLGSHGLVGADFKKFRCDLAEPVYDDTMTARADFFTAAD